MLPTRHRLVDGDSFRRASRAGRSAGSPTMVLHLDDPRTSTSEDGGPVVPARVGFVVSKAVGNAVVRNRVKRRLRHLASERLPMLGDGQVLVVRARAAAAQADSGRLAVDLDRCLDKLGAAA